MPFIMNFQSPQTLEDLIDRYYSDGMTNIDHIFRFEETPMEWTVDEETQQGDIVFFSCSAKSLTNMTELLRQIKGFEGKVSDYEELLTYANKQMKLYQAFSGHFLAVGRVATKPYQLDSAGYEFAPWTSNWYAKISDFRLLKQPLPMIVVEEFITLRPNHSRTYLTEEQYRRLLPLVLEKMDFQLKPGE